VVYGRGVPLPVGFDLLTYLFDNLPLGLVVMNAKAEVLVFNRAEERMAGRSREKIVGTNFFADIAPCMNVQQLAGVFHDKIGRGPLDVTVEMSFPQPHVERPRDVKVRMCSLEVGAQPFGFLMIEDISMQRSAQRMREQLQSLLVHDLKNPLTAISMNLQLLEELPSVRDSKDALDGIAEALDATKRLGTMTLNLLDIGRLETATMPIRRTTVDLGELFVRVRNDNAAAARTRAAQIHILLDDVREANLDEDLVVRALDNLVENALRHARNVTLSAVRDGGEIVLRVSDDGRGIPEALRASLFDKYVQVTTPGAPARGSNRGLGLTFVRLVAQQHGGDAEVACPASGGTVFTLRFAAA
jgi:photoactive yellow protein